VKIQCHSKGSYEIKGTYCFQRNGKHDELLGKIRTGVVFPENNKNTSGIYDPYQIFPENDISIHGKTNGENDFGKFRVKEA
jgi:hypothetical protein